MRYWSIPLLFCPLLCAAQQWQDTLRLRLATWHSVYERWDTLSTEELAEEDWLANDELAAALVGVLSVPGSSDQDIDSMISSEQVDRVRSADGRLTIFQWDERTGGTFRSMLHVVLFRDTHGNARLDPRPEAGIAGAASWDRGGSYTSIHVLDRTDSTTLYVCIGEVAGCSTCCSALLTVWELPGDAISFVYPAFALSDDSDDPSIGQPSWELTSRCDDITEFTYDPKHATLHYAYLTDDLTPVQAEDGKQHKVRGSLHFDGQRFVAH